MCGAYLMHDMKYLVDHDFKMEWIEQGLPYPAGLEYITKFSNAILKPTLLHYKAEIMEKEFPDRFAKEIGSFAKLTLQSINGEIKMDTPAQVTAAKQEESKREDPPVRKLKVTEDLRADFTGGLPPSIFKPDQKV